MSSHVDFVIIGQGLAGTALAWHLLDRGRNVLVIDRERGGSSHFAAGLITPVTGKRLAKSWRWEELYPTAVAYYREIETHTGTAFFHQHPALRIYQNEAEREECVKRSASLLRELVRPNADVSAHWFAAPLGAFEMDAARLDVPKYLDASREYFRERGAYLAAEIEPRDIELTATGVRLSALSVEARTVTLCRGFDAGADPYFGAIKFNAAKGEILTVRIPGLAEERVVHRGIWLAPVGDEVFRVGSTYTWEPLDSQPTHEGRAAIESRLREFLRLPFEVIGHAAAVRPVIDAGFPVMGRHPQSPQLAYFNSLGSKGSLLSPFFANQLATHLCGEGAVEEKVHVSRFLVRSST